ncbi:MAG: MBL fold metallo-hydrolase [Anaerolineae bacterium]|nr:MBL fold metallo-hydrolase [Anaerolineae bacterium]
MSIKPALEDTPIEPDTIGIWPLGQSGYALKNAYGEIIFIDPYLTEIISPLNYVMHTRLIPPVIEADSGLDVRAVLLTHDHLDHLDPNSVVMLAEPPETQFYGSSEVFDKLVHTLDIPELRVNLVAVGTDFEVGHYRVHAVKAVHGGGALGYVLEIDGLTLYFSGDTVLFYSMREIGARFSIDVAFLCINGQAGNMDILGALHAVKLVSPKVVVPNHYDMYADNTDSPERFAYLFQQRYPERTCLILRAGQLHVVGSTGRIL